MDILNLILPLNIPLLISLGILGFVYRMFDELQDASMRNKFQKEWWIFKLNWLNTTSSWKNKWALTSTMGCTIKYDKNKWYHFGITPKYKERFPYSSTIFVAFTDGEHCFQFIKNISITVGIALICWKMAVVWVIGSSIASIIKEMKLKHILD